ERDRVAGPNTAAIHALGLAVRVILPAARPGLRDDRRTVRSRRAPRDGEGLDARAARPESRGLLDECGVPGWQLTGLEVDGGLLPHDVRPRRLGTVVGVHVLLLRARRRHARAVR